jgi:hypothetical protein
LDSQRLLAGVRAQRRVLHLADMALDHPPAFLLSLVGEMALVGAWTFLILGFEKLLGIG